MSLTAQLLSPAQYRRAAWRNGGGMSDYVTALEAGDGIEWQFVLSDIDRPGPFSDYSGYDRCITLMQGKGFTLHPAGKHPQIFAKKWQPWRFPGDWAVDCALTDGPVRVVNVMTRRGHYTAGVDILPVDAKATTRSITGSALLVYGLEGDTIAHIRGEPAVTITQGSTLRIDQLSGVGSVSLSAPAGSTVYLAELTEAA